MEGRCEEGNRDGVFKGKREEGRKGKKVREISLGRRRRKERKECGGEKMKEMGKI